MSFLPEGVGLAGGALLACYFTLLALLSVYGLHRLYLVFLYRHSRSAAPVAPDDLEEWPVVTVQLPLYNEMYVAARLLDAVAGFDYPRDRLEVQVLDDSTDETRDIVAAKVDELRSRGLDVVHLHRRDRRGYKAGALEAGLQRARGELVCIFDADFVPPRGVLRTAVPHFTDPQVGMVQLRWEHLNRDYSMFTRVQAMLLDGHFAIEQAARSWSGRFFNFNGTAGIWRRQAIVDAGGWQHDTLTEDLDISYRAQLAGWRFLYLEASAAPAELPVSMDGFKSQQRRWTKGAVQTARKLLRRIWHSTAPLRVKVEATFHLTANVAYPLMVLLSLVVFPAMLVRRGGGEFQVMLVDLPVLACATGSVCAFYLAAQHAVGRRWWSALPRLPALMAVGIGISLSNSLAIIEGLGGDPGEFVRTPKFSVVRRGENWKAKRYRAARNWTPWAELLLGFYFAVAAATAVALGMWEALPFLALYLGGYSYAGLLSLGERRRVAAAG